MAGRLKLMISNVPSNLHHSIILWPRLRETNNHKCHTQHTGGTKPSKPGSTNPSQAQVSAKVNCRKHSSRWTRSFKVNSKLYQAASLSGSLQFSCSHLCYRNAIWGSFQLRTSRTLQICLYLEISFKESTFLGTLVKSVGNERQTPTNREH